MKYRAIFLSTLVLMWLMASCGSGESPQTPTNTPTVATTPTSNQTSPTATPTLPPVELFDALAQNDDLSIFYKALVEADLEEQLQTKGPHTLFAPINDAFAELPEEFINDQDALFDLLLYLIVNQSVTEDQLRQASSLTPLLGNDTPLTLTQSNGQPQINNATILGAPIQARDALIYRIDKVVLPPTISILAMQNSVPEANADLPDLLAVAQTQANLSTFLDGLEAAELLDLLHEDGPYTIFAPTDDAFTQLVERAPADLLRNLDEQPATFLLYHIATGYLSTQFLQDGLTINTLESGSLHISAKQNAVAIQFMLNGSDGEAATMPTQNLAARNGVIYIIDTVLLPPQP